MAQVFPGTLNAFSNPAGTNTLPGTESGGQAHATQHSDANDAIEAHEAVLGTTAGTSVLKNFAAGQFPVRNTGGGATGTLVQTIVGGTLNKNTLGSVGATGGTFNNATVGTPAITGGTANSIFLGTPTFSAGAVNTADIANSAVTSGKYKPGTLNYSVGTVTNQTITSTSFTPITNGTTTYTAGTVAETLLFWASLLFRVTTAGAGIVTLFVNGTELSPKMYTDVTTANFIRQEQLYMVSLGASVVGSLVLNGKVGAGGTLNVSLNTTDYVPTMRGFGVSNA